MSKSSAKATYEAFTEWHAWVKTQHPSYRVKKKKKQEPKFVSYGKK